MGFVVHVHVRACACLMADVLKREVWSWNEGRRGGSSAAGRGKEAAGGGACQEEIHWSGCLPAVWFSQRRHSLFVLGFISCVHVSVLDAVLRARGEEERGVGGLCAASSHAWALS